MLSGGGGLVSTAADYDRFIQMLLHTDASPAGELDGIRLLSPRTVGYMARNHLPGGLDLETFGRPLYAESPFRGVGFGLGFAVVLDPVPGKVIGSAGELSWGGAASTTFWIDQDERPDRLVLHPAAPVQHLPDPPAAAPARLPGADRLISRTGPADPPRSPIRAFTSSPSAPHRPSSLATKYRPMAQIVVIGGGLVGLTAGMLLARDGHQVTVTERDAAGPRGRAGDVWQRWDRRGVNQFRQLHFMLPRWRAVMERELPEVIAELEALGGVRTSMLGTLPDEMTGGKRDGDERFETVTGRRPVLEAAVAQAAKCTDGLTVCRGVAVTGLVTGAESIAGVPHVAGVTIGEPRRSTRTWWSTPPGRSPVSGMLAAIGARRPDEEKEDCGFVYYARHFRSPDGSCPPAMERLLQHFEGVSILTLPCDSGTWGVGLVTSARDKEPRALRAVPAWEAALALFPNVAHWGAAEPITGVQVIAGIEDRHRSHVVDGEPVVTGLAAVGDAWACTNPSLGRAPRSGCCTPAPCATCSARSARMSRSGWPAGSTRSPRPRSVPTTGPRSSSTGTGWPRSTARSPASRTSPTTQPGISARPCTRPRRATPTCCAPTPRWRR